MELKLYKNISKKPNSTKRPGTADYTLDVKMKQGTSVEKPTFIVSAAEDLLEVNYAAFASHYYFVNDIVLAQNNLYEISCVQDVLATYKDYIGAYSAFIERADSEDKQDLYVTNGALAERQINKQLLSIENTFYDGNNSSYFVRVAGRASEGASDGGMQDAILPPDNLRQLITGGLDDISSALYTSILHPLQYIANIVWYPINYLAFVPDGQITPYHMNLGPFTTGADGYHIRNFREYSYTIPAVDRFYDDWRDFTPGWTTCLMRVLNQTISIDPIYLRYKMKVTLTIDVRTGTAIAKVYSYIVAGQDESSTLIATVSGSAGSPEQITAGALNIVGAATGAIQTAAAAYSGNGAAALSGAINSVGNAVNNTQSINGSVGCRMAAIESGKLELHIQRKGSASDPNDWLGTPVMARSVISNFSGYVKCSGADIDLPGLAGDRTEINNYLNGGFYYE